jgi:hypothetical protein
MRSAAVQETPRHGLAKPAGEVKHRRMRKEELESILGHQVGPIEGWIEALAVERELPAYAIGQCVMRIEESAPYLLAVLDKAAAGEALSEEHERLFFRGVHILGGARQSAAFGPLLRLLRRDEAYELLGYALTETLPRIAAGAFDGDAAALFAAIEDAALDEFVRASLMGAAAFLTWDKRIERDEMVRFLARFYAAKPAPPADYAWVAWVHAVAMLNERSLVDAARAAFRDGLVTPESMDLDDFEEDLAQAEAAPDDIQRFRDAHLGYIEDVLEALEGFGQFADDEDAWDDAFLDDDVSWGEGAGTPLINPFRDVSRNDPCPCGSGKKFKKCCLA